jgi:hypothetical protein
VEIALENGYLGARPDGGIRLRPLNYVQPKAQAFATIDTAHYVSRIIVNAIESEIDTPYDWLNILGIVFHKPWHQKKHSICSRTIALAFLQVGRPLLNPAIPLFLLTPRDIALSPYVLFD